MVGLCFLVSQSGVRNSGRVSESSHWPFSKIMSNTCTLAFLVSPWTAWGMFPSSPAENSTTALALMACLSTEFLQGWFMLQESVFHSEPTPFNGTVRNWPHHYCRLGWDMVCQGWPHPCGSGIAQISCAGSMSKAWTMLSMKSADLLFYFTYSGTYQGMTHLFAL